MEELGFMVEGVREETRQLPFISICDRAALN
jgi:hypothetical protein